MSTFDFSAPFVAARIITPDGDAFPLWTNIEGEERTVPIIPGAEDLKALAFMQTVEVKLDLSGLPQISVQLAPPFEDGLKFLDSPLADGRMTNRLEVQLGYAAGTSDGGAILSAPYAVALMAPEVTIDTEISITLKGQGLGADSSGLQPGRVVPQKGETRRDIIRRLAAGPGGLRRTLRVDFSQVPNDSDAARALDEAATGFVQGGRSDWLALWMMAEATDCVMNVVGPSENEEVSRLMWLPKRSIFSRPPTRRYRLYHIPSGGFRGVSSDQLNDTELAEFPILSFSCNTEAVWNAVRYQDILNHGVRMDGVNADSVEAETVSSTLEDLAAPVDSGQGAQTTDSSESLPLSGDEGRMVLPGDPDNEEARRRVQAEVEDGAPMGVQCELEILGDPTILPGDMVALGGLGRRFENTSYRVYTVSHSIGVGGYSTNLSITTNIDSVYDHEEARVPTGPPNTVETSAATDSFEASSVIKELELEELTGLVL